MPRPKNSQATAITASVIGNAQRKERAGRPVRSATCRRHRLTPHRVSPPRTRITTGFQFWPSYQNTLAPRTLITASGPSSHESSGRGKAFCTMAMKDRITSASSGTLRMISTYHFAALRTMKFCESLAMPTMVPSTVASTMPVIDSRSVLRRPSTMASRVVCVVRNVLDGMGKPAGWSSQLNHAVSRPCCSDVVLVGAVEPPDHRDDHDHDRDLDRPRDDADISPEGRSRRGRRGAGQGVSWSSAQR